MILELLALIFAALPAAGHPETAGEKAPSGRITVLVTHPSAGELRNMEHLVEKGLLQVPGLRLLGVYHRDEFEDYSGGEALAAGRDWMDLRRLDCEIEAKDVFIRNDCSDEFDELFRLSAGAIFTGGPDIPPGLYGEETRLTTVIEDPARHYFEVSFLFHLLGSSRNPGQRPLLDSRPDYLVLGLCLGMQSMNVAAGGTLIQDIPRDLYGIETFEGGLRLSRDQQHRSFQASLFPAPDAGWGVVHSIRFVGGAELGRILLPQGGAVRVLSVHHQAVGKLGQGLEAQARSLDGKVVEALRHTKYPAALGVQFHPEKRLLWDETVIYRERSDSPTANHVATWFAGDEKARQFVRAFWKLVGELIQNSAHG